MTATCTAGAAKCILAAVISIPNIVSQTRLNYLPMTTCHCTDRNRPLPAAQVSSLRLTGASH